MKKILLLIFMCICQYSIGQVQYAGCSAAIPGPYPYTLTLSGTVDDGGIIRNTYTSALPGSSCGAGVCAFRINWSLANTRWEITLSTDGGATFPAPQILYYNVAASEPNPPSINLGLWVDNLGGGCGGDGSIAILTGDVQDQVLSITEANVLAKEIIIYPNPVSNVLNIKSLKHVIKEVTIYSILGKRINHIVSNFSHINVSSLSKGMYLVQIETTDGVILNKKLLVN